MLNSIISWFKIFKDFFNRIIDGINSILKGITNIADKIVYMSEFFNPFDEKFFLKIALIPKEDFFKDYFTELFDAFKGKITIVEDIAELFKSISNIAVSNQIPEFTVNLFGDTYNIVDFRYFTEFRTLVIGFIKFPMWFFFIKKVYYTLPWVIY